MYIPDHLSFAELVTLAEDTQEWNQFIRNKLINILIKVPQFSTTTSCLIQNYTVYVDEPSKVLHFLLCICHMVPVPSDVLLVNQKEYIT